MMQPDAIKQLIEHGLPGCRAEVTGDGHHFEALVIGEVFAGKSLLAQQRLVYAVLNEKIESGELHAISIKTKVE